MKKTRKQRQSLNKLPRKESRGKKGDMACFKFCYFQVKTINNNFSDDVDEYGHNSMSGSKNDNNESTLNLYSADELMFDCAEVEIETTISGVKSKFDNKNSSVDLDANFIANGKSLVNSLEVVSTPETENGVILSKYTHSFEISHVFSYQK